MFSEGVSSVFGAGHLAEADIAIFDVTLQPQLLYFKVLHLAHARSVKDPLARAGVAFNDELSLQSPIAQEFTQPQKFCSAL